jgi:hypothetical protein
MSVESRLMSYWNSSRPVTELVTGGLWRDEIPENGTNGSPVEMPFARFTILSEVESARETKPDRQQRQHLEEQLLQIDIFARDPLTAKRARDRAKELIDGWEPVLNPPDIFLSIDRTNAFLFQDPDEDDGASVWHAGLEYIVTLQRSKNG